MCQPKSMRALEALGRVRLSDSFFMRDFLYSEIANFHGIPNYPEAPDLAIRAGRRLCGEILEPLQARFGRLSIRGAYRSPTVNRFGNDNRMNCAKNETAYGRHIWDRPDAAGNFGATACIVVASAVPYYERTGDWQALAWWVHDHLPYSDMVFYPKLAAFNISWSESPKRRIYSQIPPHRGHLTKPGRANHAGRHDDAYADLLRAVDG